MIAIAADAKADRAIEKQDDHEKICAERYLGIRNDISSLKGIIVKSATGLIIGLLALCGFLLKVQFFP